ncbi:hypothetical protein B0H13DRAFT_146814 [Mycena leptocephala]|nr:hypothetical protein B0H13DRAFT_146814 [Mycena leptocephala]
MQWTVALGLFTVYRTKTLRDTDRMLHFWLGTTSRSSVPRVPIGRLRVNPTSPLQTHAILGARTCGMHTAASTPNLRVPPTALHPPRVSSASSTAPLDVRSQLPRTPPASPIAPLLAPTHPLPSTPRPARALDPYIPDYRHGHAANCSACLRAPRPPRRHPPSIPLKADTQNLRHVQRPGTRFSAPTSMQRPTVFPGGRSPSLLFLAAGVTWRRPSFGFRFDGLSVPTLVSQSFI